MKMVPKTKLMMLFIKKYLILIFLLVNIQSCLYNKINKIENSDNQEEVSLVNSREEEFKEKNNSHQTFNKEKLAKEALYIVAWDITVASICKNGLHLSIGICLAADIVGDIGIIGYNSFDKTDYGHKKNFENDSFLDSGNKNNTKNLDKDSGLNEMKKIKFKPVDFVLSIGLMAIILIVI